MAACAGCRVAWNDVVAVRADWSCERGAYAIGFVEDRLMLSTSAYPRDIPGVPRERNLNGVSFAVANAERIRRACARSGTAARRRRTRPRSPECSPRSKQGAGIAAFAGGVMATPRISTVLAARSAWCGLGVLVLVAAGITANAQGDLVGGPPAHQRPRAALLRPRPEHRLPRTGDGAADAPRHDAGRLRARCSSSSCGSTGMPLAENERPLEARVLRELRKVNGRVAAPELRAWMPRPQVRRLEPLAFLLPHNRGDYTFAWNGVGRLKDRRTMMLDYTRPRGRRDRREMEGRLRQHRRAGPHQGADLDRRDDARRAAAR